MSEVNVNNKLISFKVIETFSSVFVGKGQSGECNLISFGKSVSNERVH